MSEKRFTTDYSDFLKNAKTFIKMDNERLTYEEIVDLLNKQQSKIKELEKENDELKKQLEDCKDYNSKIYANCLQKDRKWIKEVKRLNKELEESIKENAKLRERYINDE